MDWQRFFTVIFIGDIVMIIVIVIFAIYMYISDRRYRKAKERLSKC